MSDMWTGLVVTIFLIMLGACLIMSGVAYVCVQIGWIDFGAPRPLTIMVAVLMGSVAIGTVIAILIGDTILIPVKRMGKMIEDVSHGNFKDGHEKGYWVKEVEEAATRFSAVASELASVESLKNDFAVNMTHELKTPIAAIEGYATLLQDPDISEEERLRYTAIIQESARQLSSFSANILNLSKLENQGNVGKREPFDLAEQIRHAVLMYEPQWAEKKLEMDIDLEEADYCGNQELLMQVWLNLFGNAVKFTPEGGTIRARMETREKNIAVIISDTGIGMSPETQRHVFEKFYQADAARFSGGNGLGLSLVKRILDLGGGVISVDSTEGQGSTFSVTLPILPSA